MSDDIPPLERLLERTARFVSGGGLHPVELLERIQSAYVAAIDGRLAPNRITVRLSREDYDRLAAALADLHAEAARLLEEVDRERRLQHIGGKLISFSPDDNVGKGIPAVSAQFADTVHRPARTSGHETGIIHRHRGVAIMIEGSGRVALTHTPFSIGRGPGNDLVIPSLAVSRDHARIVFTGQSFVIEDLGSSNGIVVAGERCASAVLDGGTAVTLGNATLRLEQAS